MQHTLYLTTGGGDLRHTEVGGANDIIVTGSVPGMRKILKNIMRQKVYLYIGVIIYS